MLYNYKALSLQTTLDSKILLPSADLENFINDLQANTTLYHGYYDMEKRDRLAQYEGLLKPVFDSIHIDMDSKEDNGALAWEQTKALCKRLHESGCGFQLYFSGNKGFHVAIHTSAFGLSGTKPAREYQDIIRSIAHNLKEQYSTVDPAIHDPVRKFRAFRSRNEKSGLYKIRLTGIGLPKKISDYTIDEIRNLALMQPTHKYAHPTPVEKPVDFLVNLLNQSTPHQSQGSRKSKVKELNQGETIADDSLRFKNFADKRCIKQMMEGIVLPQFNRHDIELALIVEMRQQGRTLDEAIKLMDAWGAKVYTSEPDRLKDIDRQVRDIYKKDLEADKLYQYGCYGDVKSAYCSAKCKIYNNLDKKRRPEPLDCNKAQKTENEVRRNPALEMSEGMIADKILEELGDICTSNQEYFRWSKTHWSRIDRERFEYMLKQACINSYQNMAKTPQIVSLYKHILAKIPVAPETNCFFATSPDKFNFTDGTCHITKDYKGNVKLEMLPHDPKDMLSYCAPFPLYGPENLPRSGDFKHYVDTRREALGDEGMLALKQLFGAALIPYEPRIFFLLGDSNTGKSTSAIILERLLGAENVSGCDPTSDYQFEWEPSIGKIANIRRELPPRRPLQDDKLKEFRDKRPVGVSRKGIKGVMATVPFLHVYCCNKLPPSLEGNTGALNNRITILKFKPSHVNGFGAISNLGDWLWDRDAGGILEFAREGLKLLIENNFKYGSVKDSDKILQEWQDETDPVKLYFNEVRDGERKIDVDLLPNGGILGIKVYDDFKKWAAERSFYAMSHIKFYKELERCGVEKAKKMEQGKVIFWDAKGIKQAGF